MTGGDPPPHPQVQGNGDGGRPENGERIGPDSGSHGGNRHVQMDRPFSSGDGHRTGYDSGYRDGNQYFGVGRPFAFGESLDRTSDPAGPQQDPAVHRQNDAPRAGFPPIAPPIMNRVPPTHAVPSSGRPASTGATPAPEQPRILVQEFGGFRCAELDPWTGSLHEASERMGPLSGVYSDLDGVELVFFRTDGRLFLRVGGQVTDADDLAIIVHWQPVGRRHTEFIVTRAGFPVCRVRYRRQAPELDPGLWIRGVLDNPAHRTQIFAEVRGVP